MDEEFLAEVMSEFFDECEELLVEVDSSLVALEESFTPELVSSAFRALHTIKGSAGFLGLAGVESAAHEGEEILARVRAGELAVDAPVVDALLGCVDRVREQVSLVHAAQAPGLEVLQEDGQLGAGALATPASSADGGVSTGAATTDEASVGGGSTATGDVMSGDREGVASGLPVAGVSCEPGQTPLEAEVAVPAGTSGALPDAGELQRPAAGPYLPGAAKSEDRETVRVDVAVLDRLVTTVAELSLARNRVRASVGDDRLREMNVLLAELQDAVIRTRMQPLNVLFSKLPRTVRDLARALGKEVRLDISGGDIEIDRALLDVVRDPLSHVLRNAVDHGVESRESRVSAGKSPVGVVSVRARHEAGLVVISVSDDGAGVNLSQVRARAAEMGAPIPDDAMRAIFLPGLSTSDEVTLVSGRGVGMDVVRKNLESVGGQVHVDSRPGKGTTVTLRVPLTIALLPALLVGAAGQQFMLPQAHVSELVRVQEKDLVHAGGARMLDVRGHLLDVLSLEEVLGIAAPASPATHVAPPRSSFGRFGVVVTDGQRRAIVEVDDVCGGDDIVVKPLDAEVIGSQAYVGAAILEHGEPCLVLDVPHLIERVPAVLPRTRREGQAASAAPEARLLRVLIVESPTTGALLAVEAQAVERVEIVSRDDVHSVGGEWFVRWRGELLPMAGAWPEAAIACSGVVLRDADNVPSYVLVSGSVLDLAEAEVLPIVPSSSGADLQVVDVNGKVAHLMRPQDLLGAGARAEGGV